MYQIQPLKNQFDTFLSEMSFTDANIYKLLETLEIYKFQKLKVSLGNYLVGNWRTLFERDDFLKANKNVFLGILELDRDRNEKIENALFEKVFTWAENQAREKAADFETLKIEDQQKLIKYEMSEFLLKFKFNFRSENFMDDFVAPRSYVFDDWDAYFDIAIDDMDFIETEDIQFYVKFQILPKKFNGRYHQVLRGFIYAESEDPVNKLIEHIQSFPNDNGAYYMNPSWDRCISHLKFLKDLKYLDDEQTQYILGFDCGSQIAIVNTNIFEYN
uniref:Uncharacterized protein n=1 Tax=Panagrolaimus davidi TaxID=227884 RepID=A0A914QV52_9BILA